MAVNQSQQGMSGPAAYLRIPWRTGPLGIDERRENLEKALDIMRRAVSLDPRERDEVDDHRAWAAACIEYEDLLDGLGHGLGVRTTRDDRDAYVSILTRERAIKGKQNG